MEDMTLAQQLLALAVPAALMAITAALGFGWGRLRTFVASTETDLDDKVLAAIEGKLRTILAESPATTVTEAPPKSTE